MPQIMQARPGLARSPAEAELTREPDKGLGQMNRADWPAGG